MPISGCFRISSRSQVVLPIEAGVLDMQVILADVRLDSFEIAAVVLLTGAVMKS